MKTSHFKTQQIIQKPIESVFAFFSDARNLAIITPPWLRFEILTPSPIEMKVGTRLDYRLKIRGFPLRWQSEITVWNPPDSFADEQRRGPYRLWRHTHTFTETGDGTAVYDEVEYAVWGHSLVNALFVKRDVEQIFAYRAQQLEQLFQ